MSSTVYINKYERVKIISIRAQEIANGSEPLVECDDEINPIKIAHKEYDAGFLKNLIRTFPNGDKKIINLT
jgi:DNA-directed RNA polymerase subunit K/omega